MESWAAANQTHNEIVHPNYQNVDDSLALSSMITVLLYDSTQEN